MTADIYNQLSDISKGRYGSDIRYPIHDALAILAEGEYDRLVQDTNGALVNYPDLNSSDVDISEELNTISVSTSGAEVKQAIHDALYKMSFMFDHTRTIVTGLTAIDISNPEPPSGPNYVADFQNDDRETADLERVKDFLKSSGLFSDVTYESTSGVSEIVSIYVDDVLFVKLSYLYMEDPIDPSDSAWYYELTVYTDGSGETDSLSYPTDVSTVSLRTSLNPMSGMKTDMSVLLTCASNAILFSRNSAGSVSVSFGAGYAMYGSFVNDAANRIRTFTPHSTISSYGGIAHSHENIRSKAGLSPLISEGDAALTFKGYCVTYGTIDGRADAFVPFGQEKLYMALDMLAIEV